MAGNLAYQDEFREELIGGRLVAMPPASTNHNRVSGNLYHLFRSYLDGKPCEPFGDGESVFLTETDEFVPDFMVVCDADKVKHDGIHGAPDLVVEVLSHSTARNDRGRKMAVYDQCGVREYWIVDPVHKTVEQYLPDNSRFALHDLYAVCPDYELEKMSAEKRAAIVTEFKCTLFDDLTIRLEDVFHRVT